jgi:hypothetical protein
MNMDQLREVMDKFVSRNFRDWPGLPSNGTLTAVRQYFNNDSDDIGEAALGNDFCQYLVVTIPGYGTPVRIWSTNIDEKVVLLDAPNPELQPGLSSLLDELGEPAAQLDTYWGTLSIPDGEWVYPERGLALFVSERDEKVFHLAVFQPTTLADYEENLRFSLRKRRMRRGGGLS